MEDNQFDNHIRTKTKKKKKYLKKKNCHFCIFTMINLKVKKNNCI